MECKFKVGELYKVSDTGASEFGNTIRITKVIGSVVYYETLSGTPGNQARFEDESYFAKNLKRVSAKPANKIVITSDGTTTLARLYDGNKVVKSAEAKCSPDDTYDFTIGANLAYDRLMRPTAKPVQDKPKYKVGDKAKIINNNSNHGFDRGEIVKIHSNPRKLSGGWCWICTQEDGMERFNPHVYESDIEPYTEPTKEPAEPVKLYCVKDGVGFHKIKSGDICEFRNGHFIFPDGEQYEFSHKDIDDFCKQNTGYAKANFVPLVKRPAKVGEWIYISKSHSERFIGTIGKVIDFVDKQPKINHNRVWFSLNPDGTENTVLSVHTGYLVLDGYKPEEPAKEEPKGWTGKVVCVAKDDYWSESSLTVGKVYSIKDGVFYDNRGLGNITPKYTDVPNKKEKFVYASFIEYKGEQA